MTPSARAFPQTALETLDFPAVLAWIAEGAATPAGRRALLAARPGIALVDLAGGRARGREAHSVLDRGDAPPGGRCGDLSALGADARRRVLGGEELAELAESLALLAALRAWLAARPALAALGAALAAAPSLDELLAELRRTVDGRGEVRDEADPGLAEVRLRRRELEQRRQRELERVAEQWRQLGLLQNPRPVQRHGRLALAVKATHQGRARGVVHDQSHSGDTVYVEPEAVLALSNRLADAEARERRLVHAVLAECSRHVARHRGELEAADERLGQVDAAFAAAAWCRAVGGCWPELPAPSLELRGARHPLLLRQAPAERVVPLDLSLGADFDLLVVTGPNTGGKTVVLKTVGLLAALAASGLPISAAPGSGFPELPGIDADIGDAQSIESSLSTFSGHLERVLRVLADGPPGGLVLLDELGTGTDPEEGSALGQAVLQHLLRRRSLVLASTHLGALKLFSVRVERAENASMEFDPVTLAPSFRLLVGVPGASHALEVAERLGLPAELLADARARIRRGAGAEALLAEVADVRRRAERLRESARDADEEARRRLREAAEEEDASRHRAELRLREAEMAFRDLRSAVERLLERDGAALCGRLPAPSAAGAGALFDALRRLFEENDLGRRWGDFLAGLRKGEVVYVPRFRERLRVVKVEPRRQRAKLRRGNLEIEVPFHEISWVEPPPGADPDPA